MPLAPPPIRTPFLLVDPKGQILNQLSQPWAKWLIGLLVNVQTGVDASATDSLYGPDPSFPSQIPDVQDVAAAAEPTPAVFGRSTDLITELQGLTSQPGPQRDWSQAIAEIQGLIGREFSPGQYGFQIIQDIFANRVNYPAAAYLEGSLFRMTNFGGKVVWQAIQVSGATQWVYVSGFWSDTLANMPTANLGVNDSGLPGNPMPSGGYHLYDTAGPIGDGVNAWQVCDGSTVARLNYDGTTTNVPLVDLTTPPYLKVGITSAATALAAGNTPTGTVSQPTFTGNNTSTGNDTASVTMDADVSGATHAVADHPHQHTYTPSGTVSQPTFTGSTLSSLELLRVQKALFFRR